MAEENSKKPKVELIKHSAPVKTSDTETSKSADTERRKVVVVKKKSPAPFTPKKPNQPKVVSVHPQEPRPKQDTEKTVPEKDKKAKQEFMPRQRPVGAAGRVGGRPVGTSESHTKRSHDGSRQNSPYPFSQRPAGAAGRVGGRPVGNDGHSGYAGRTGQE